MYRIYYRVVEDCGRPVIVVTGVKKLAYGKPSAPDDQEPASYSDPVTGEVFFGLKDLKLRDQMRRDSEIHSRSRERSRHRSRSRERSRRRSRSRERSRRRSRSRSPVKEHDPLEELRLRKECAEAEARKAEAEAVAQKAMAESQIQPFQPWPAPPPPVLPAPPLGETGQNFVYQTPPGYGNPTYWVDRSGSTQ